MLQILCSSVRVKYNFAKFLPTLGYDLKIACAKFQGNRFIIDGEMCAIRLESNTFLHFFLN